MVVNGAHPGPTFVVTGGTYPTEFCGVEAAGRLFQSVPAANLTGKLVVVPVANMPVLQFRSPMFALTYSVSPFDGKMLASVFPGDPAGSPTEVLAHVLFERFIANADFHGACATLPCHAALLLLRKVHCTPDHCTVLVTLATTP